MATGKTGKDRTVQEARERARLYQARQELYAANARRRVRDNWLAGIIGGLVIIGAIGGQIAYYSAGPGLPIPSPTPTVSPSTTPTPDPSIDPSAEPSSDPTPVETPAP